MTGLLQVYYSLMKGCQGIYSCTTVYYSLLQFTTVYNSFLQNEGFTTGSPQFITGLSQFTTVLPQFDEGLASFLVLLIDSSPSSPLTNVIFGQEL